MIVRSKTLELFQQDDLSKTRKINSGLNTYEAKEEKVLLESYPRRIVLELTNSCNLRCKMCGRDDVKFVPTFLPLEEIVNPLRNILEYAEEVTLFGWGEPLIHPQFEDYLSFLNIFHVRKYFVTNGMRLKEKIETIFENNVDIIAISLDGPSAEINDPIRVGSSFEKIVNNIRELVTEKKRRGKKNPYINFVFTAMKSNINYLPAMVSLAKELDIEEVKVVYLTIFSEKLKEESLWNCQDLTILNFAAAEVLANKLNIKLKLPYIQGNDIAWMRYHKECFVGWRDLFIGSDGYIRPCQSIKLKFKHISEYESIEELWNSVDYQNFRRQVNADYYMIDECKRCYQSSHANFNREKAFNQISEEWAPTWEKKKEESLQSFLEIALEENRVIKESKS